MEKNGYKVRANQKVILRPNGRAKIVTVFDGEEAKSRTQQQFKEQCDVNNIMNKYKAGKPITHINTKTGVYGDLTEFTDYAESLQKVIHARESFMDLPSNIRTRFGNDPAQLIRFLDDSKNRDEAISLGLIKKPEAPKPDPVLEEIKGLRSDMKKPAKPAKD